MKKLLSLTLLIGLFAFNYDKSADAEKAVRANVKKSVYQLDSLKIISVESLSEAEYLGYIEENFRGYVQVRSESLDIREKKLDHGIRSLTEAEDKAKIEKIGKSLITMRKDVADDKKELALANKSLDSTRVLKSRAANEKDYAYAVNAYVAYTNKEKTTRSRQIVFLVNKHKHVEWLIFLTP